MLDVLTFIYLQLQCVSGAEQDADISGVLNAKMLPWLDQSLAGMNGGIRRLEQELVIAFANLPSAGVVSASKQHFLLQQITSLANSYPRSFVAVVVMPNRAADHRAKPLVVSYHFHTRHLLSFLDFNDYHKNPKTNMNTDHCSACQGQKSRRKAK